MLSVGPSGRQPPQEGFKAWRGKASGFAAGATALYCSAAHGSIGGSSASLVNTRGWANPAAARQAGSPQMVGAPSGLMRTSQSPVKSGLAFPAPGPAGVWASIPGEKAITATTTMIEPIKRFRIGKSLLLSISQLQMQFGISPLETHKPRLKMSPSRSKDHLCGDRAAN